MSSRTACLVCGHTRLSEVIDLGLHPFADRFIPEDQLGTPDPVFPLVLDQCEACGQVQSRTVTDPQERYAGAVPYAYTSANSQTSRAHWQEFVLAVFARHGNLYSRSRVLEIGSNDGYLGQQFEERGLRVLGVDPSGMPSPISTLETYWSAAVAHEIAEPFNLIIANNVFNHANDPIDFLQGIAAVLSADGMFVCEVPAWERLVLTGGFDQIYHEHVTYWTIGMLARACKQAGLVIVHGELVEYHGGSWRIYARRGEATAQYSNLLSDYSGFRSCVERQRADFLSRLAHCEEDRLIVCIGAAAKANTFLTYYGLADSVHYVTDNSPQKIGKWTPGTRIPIVADSILAHLDHPYAIVTAWNLIDQIKPALAQINPDIEYLNPREAL